MPRLIKQWNQSDLKNAPVGVHFVGQPQGLTLHIKAPKSPQSQPQGCWVLRANVGSKRRNIGLGTYPEVGLAEARRKATELKDLCSQGIDPIELRQQKRANADLQRLKSKTFKQLAEEYLTTHESDYRNEKHRKQWRTTIETYAYPVIGQLPIAQVGIEDVLRVLKPIWSDKTETASRLQGRIEKIFDLAIASGLRETNPARWKNFVSLRLPAPSRITEVKHYPSLPYQALPQFMQALSGRGGIGARALEFLILTAVRSGSVRQARWPEIDFHAREWRIPNEHTKTKTGVHRVPLTDQMIVLLKSLPRSLNQNLIFPSPTGKVLSDMALNVLMRKMLTTGELAVEAVPHGFRSTFRVWAAEATNYPSELAELCLMHSIGSAVYQAYQRSDLFEKRRNIMRDWNDTVFKRCESVVAIA
jgi:integrase